MYFILKLILLQIYPAYACFKAIKANDHTQFLPMLMYWVTATSFLVTEHFADLLLFWIPFYTEIKVLLVVWITLPQTKGAIVLYADLIEPFLKQHEARIDRAFIEIQGRMKHTIAVYGKQLLQIVNKLGRTLISDEAGAASVPEQPAQEPQQQPWEGWGYAVYSSLITRGAQLSASLQASAQNRLSNQGQQPGPAAEEQPKLERSDSYDSLGSFVANRRTSAPSSASSNTSDPSESKSQAAETSTWGSYLSGWWRAPEHPKKD
ncbi:TB2/DP1, HVA22 family-domain-containing protein [Fennellomyces sp. T-0311]|nr:TB2/DP1, HVA22 family-domain-containing protein [Fennellomyces sp. T-0311]